MRAAVPAVTFDYVHHLVTIPVSVNGIDSRFVLDSGIGITLVSEALCEQAHCTLTGATYSGSRMSGQEVSVALARVGAIEIADVAFREPTVGVLGLDLPDELAGIGGFVSLGLLAQTPFTVDYPRRTFAFASDAVNGAVVPLQLERDGPSLSAFCDLRIPGGRIISVEVDMGSDSLILDERFAEEVGVDLEAGSTRRVEGTDETGNRYLRRFARLEGAVQPPGAPELAQARPEVMFQRIVHAGLLGDAFLRRFAVTWDLPRERLLFARAG